MKEKLVLVLGFTLSIQSFGPPVPGGTTVPPTGPTGSMAPPDDSGRRRDESNERMRLHNEAIAAKRLQAQELRRQAKELQQEIIEKMRAAIQRLDPPVRRRMLGELEPNPPPPSAPSPSSSPVSPPSGALPWEKILVWMFWEENAFALAGGTTVPNGPFQFDHSRVSIRQSMDQIYLQKSFVNELGKLPGRFSRTDSSQLTTLESRPGSQDMMTQVKAIAALHKVDPDSAAAAVRAHFIWAAGKALTVGTLATIPPAELASGEEIRTMHVAAAQESLNTIKTSTDNSDAIRNATIDEMKSDLPISVRKVSDILDEALKGLKQAKSLEDQANILDQEANNMAKNPPKGPSPNKNGNGNQQQPQNQDQGQGNGDGKGDKNKGQPLQAAQVPMPGAIPDGRGLFDAATREPVTPSVSAVADASKIDSQPNPKFEGIGGSIGLPNILRSTASPQLADATAGTPPGPTNVIPGNAVTGNSLDRAFFENKNEGGGGGGSEKPPSFGGAVTGGTAGSFGGEDIGRGMGPSYGGRAGLSDAVKTVAYGTGGGVNTSETSATISTGADGFPPQVLAQLATGKKMKDGPGKGAVGLMGQVFSLVQSQCGDNTQRGKMEDFCGNVTQVAARAQTKAMLANDQPPRRDLASERGAVSSK